MAEELIELREEDFLGEGHQRLCYRHPRDPSLCIKVLKPRRSAFRQQMQELAVLNKLKRSSADMSFVTEFMGEVETTKGRGYMFPFVTEGQGRGAARSLSKYLTSKDLNKAVIQKKMRELGRYLLNNGVVFRDLNTTNILCVVEESGEVSVKIIDGLGDRVDFPLSLLNQVPFLLRKKIRRRWSKLVGGLKDQYSWIELERVEL